MSIGMLDVISPPICLSCQRKMVVTTRHQSGLICRPCRLTWNAAQRELCEVCALPRPVIQCREGSWIRLACSHCVTTDFRFFQAYVLGPYRGLLRQLVLRTKVSHGSPLCYSLGRLLGERILQVQGHTSNSLPGFDMVCPVPMHWRRRWHRRVNGADFIARAVGDVLGCSVNSGLLRCTRLAKKQGTLTVNQRVRNVKSCYKVNRRQVRSIEQRRVLVVDDIMTSGATLNELSDLLLRKGAVGVAVAAIARGGYGNDRVSPILPTGRLR